MLQRVIQPVLHSIHLLLADSGIKDGLPAVPMHEGHTLLRSHNAVGTGLQSFRCGKLIAGLEAFATADLNVAGAPVLVGGCHHLLHSGTDHIDMGYRLLHIRPQLYTCLPVGNLHIALAQMQNLAEMLHVQARGQTDAEATLLEQRIVLVERARPRQIEQHIAPFHPYIHADVAPSAGHRLRGIVAGRTPLIVLGLTKSLIRQES